MEEALERAQGEVATRLSGRQRRGVQSTIVEMDGGPPHPDDVRITLVVGRLGGAMRAWPPGAKRVELALPDTVVQTAAQN